MEKIGLQLWSVKELCGEDFAGTLKKVSDIGYDGVEFAGFYDTPARDLKKVLDDLGLCACGSHTSIDLLTGDIDEVIEYNRVIGNEYIICPALPPEMRNSADAWKRTGELFNELGSKCKDNGMKFGYHNHNFEFEKFDGKYGYDILGENTCSDLVLFEIDTYWVEYAGLKSVDYMEKYNNRLELIHIKELKSFEDKKSTEIGNGVMDFGAIAKLAKKYGTKWYIIEQEAFDKPYLQSVAEGYEYLRSIL